MLVCVWPNGLAVGANQTTHMVVAILVADLLMDLMTTILADQPQGMAEVSSNTLILTSDEQIK